MLLETRFPKLLYGEAVVAAAAAVVSPPPQPYQISHLADQLFRIDFEISDDFQYVFFGISAECLRISLKVSDTSIIIIETLEILSIDLHNFLKEVRHFQR